MTTVLDYYSLRREMRKYLLCKGVIDDKIKFHDVIVEHIRKNVYSIVYPDVDYDPSDLHIVQSEKYKIEMYKYINSEYLSVDGINIVYDDTEKRLKIKFLDDSVLTSFLLRWS